MKTFQFASRSSNDTHIVTVNGTKITCTCRGFRTPTKCWHVKDVAAKLRAAPVTTPTDGLAPAAARIIAPMLASALPEGRTIEDYATEDYVLEPKYDGHRLLLRVAETSVVSAWARSGHTRALPAHLIKAARTLAPGLYDGELYIPGHTSTDVTRIELQRHLQIALFDVLAVYDVRVQRDVPCLHLAGQERRALLEQAATLLDNERAVIGLAPQYPVNKLVLHTLWAQGEEGAIVKHRDVRYQPGKRVPGWIKFKKERAAKVTIKRFEKGRYGPHSVIVGIDVHGVEVRVKSRTDAWRADFADDWHSYIGRTLVISYQDKTRDGRYRHPMADHLL